MSQRSLSATLASITFCLISSSISSLWVQNDEDFLRPSSCPLLADSLTVSSVSSLTKFSSICFLALNNLSRKEFKSSKVFSKQKNLITYDTLKDKCEQIPLYLPCCFGVSFFSNAHIFPRPPYTSEPLGFLLFSPFPFPQSLIRLYSCLPTPCVFA